MTIAHPPWSSDVDAPWLGSDTTPWPFGGAPNGTLLVWESPQIDNALVIWQQPHVIWLADAQRRAANASGGETAAMLEVREGPYDTPSLVSSVLYAISCHPLCYAPQVQRLSPLVFATADYLAARLYLNESDGGPGGGRFWLGPPVMGGEESSDAFRNYNPTFEMGTLGFCL